MMKVALYETASGRSPVEDFIDNLPKADQARFADVFEGIEKLDLAALVFSFGNSEVSSGKSNSTPRAADIVSRMSLLKLKPWFGFMLLKRKLKKLRREILSLPKNE